MRDPFSEALIHAVFAGVSFLCVFLLGPVMIYVSGFFAVASAGYLAYGLFREL